MTDVRKFRRRNPLSAEIGAQEQPLRPVLAGVVDRPQAPSAKATPPPADTAWSHLPASSVNACHL